MHKFYQTYKTDTNFFTLDDFITYVGDAISDFYNQLYQVKYGELRKDKKEEIVSFDTNVLSESVLKVPEDKCKNSVFYIDLEQPIMSFLYDQNNVGLQIVLYNKKGCEDFEDRAYRSTLAQKFAVLKGLPIVDRVFYFQDGDRLGIINKRMLPIDNVKIYFIPSVYEDMIVPDGIADKVIQSAIMNLKESKKGVVVMRELGNNPNQTIETEIDKSQLKP